MKRLLLLASAIWLACVTAVAAPNINCVGQVVDEVNEPLAGAAIRAVGTQIVAIADANGQFRINVPASCKKLNVSFVGYKPVELAPAANLGVIVMEPDSKLLNDVVVTQSIGRTRETPVAMSTISAEQLEFKLGNSELLEVLKTTPGVYTRSEGGGWGDAKTRVRGFESENVAMLINGIPINDQEWGGGLYEQLGRTGRGGILDPDTARTWRHDALHTFDRRHHQHHHPHH